MGKGRLQRAVGIVGLACYWPYLRRFEFEQLFYGYAAPSAMWTSYTAVTWLNVALLVICALRHDRFDRLAQRPAFGVAAGVLAALGYSVIAVGPLLGAAAELPALLVGSGVLSAGFCGLTLAWMSWLSRGATGHVLEDSLASFALCCTLSFSSLLPPGAVLAFMVASPLASGLLWSRLGPADRPARPVGPLGALGGEKPRASLIAAVILLFLIGRITAGLLHFDKGGIDLIERTTSVAVSCLILAAIYLTARRAGNLASMVRQAWLALVVTFLAGETVVVLLGGVFQEVGMAVFWASLGCFEVLVLAVVALWCSATGASPTATLGIATVLLRVVPSWVGKYAVPAGMTALGIAPSSTVGAFVLASSLLLMSSTLLFMNAVLKSQETPAAAEPPARSQADAVTRLAQTYQLTPREADILGLLLQGLSYQAIADRLDVALSTVQTHTKGIYRKLDVHSRDELVERAQQGR